MDDNIIKYIGALIFLLAAILYVTIKKRGHNQEKENQEKNIELVIYNKEKERLEEKLRKNEISKNDYERLRKKLDEQHQIIMKKIYIES